MSGTKNKNRMFENEVNISLVNANPMAVGEFAKYLLTKRAEAKPSEQNCVARFTPDTLFLLESSSESQQSTVLSNFKLAQIVHCVEINAPDNKPGSQRKLLVVITSEPHSAQWIDLTSGGLHICHFFETSNPAEVKSKFAVAYKLSLAEKSISFVAVYGPLGKREFQFAECKETEEVINRALECVLLPMSKQKPPIFRSNLNRPFAERVLNLQLVRLAALNEEGESPEKARIMENILRSSEWNSSSVVGRSLLRQVPEVTEAKTTAELARWGVTVLKAQTDIVGCFGHDAPVNLRTSLAVRELGRLFIVIKAEVLFVEARLWDFPKDFAELALHMPWLCKCVILRALSLLLSDALGTIVERPFLFLPDETVPSKDEEEDTAPIYGDDTNLRASDDEAVLVDLEPKPEDCGE
ncbi:hypothetical protein ACTXT7_000480 [Hymenolepis weldensis]